MYGTVVARSWRCFSRGIGNEVVKWVFAPTGKGAEQAKPMPRLMDENESGVVVRHVGARDDTAVKHNAIHRWLHLIGKGEGSDRGIV
jgi:hypothetical protein